MRLSLSVFLLGVAIAGDADASSLILLEPATGVIGPSMIAVGAPGSAAETGESGSVVAVGQPVPAVSDEKLSSIGTEPAPRAGPAATPMVIRGGIVGDAFVRGTATPIAEPRQAVTRNTPAPAAVEPDEPVVGHSAESELDLQ